VKYAPLIVSLLTSLAGCAKGDFATVSIEYHRTGHPEAFSLEISEKQRIVAAFTRVAAEKHYECHAHAKRVEEISCFGPKKMNITFQPELNRMAYTARFNWLELNDRTRDEFETHVAAFAEAMRDAVADSDISISTQRR
jgi:hypothetical protein